MPRCGVRCCWRAARARRCRPPRGRWSRRSWNTRAATEAHPQGPRGTQNRRDARDARSTAQALALFDSLAAVHAGELRGAWRGEGFHTGHPLDGLLEAAGWLGKRFDGDEQVQPLVVSTWLGPRAIRAGPALPGICLVMRWPALKGAARAVRLLGPLVATPQAQARLRQVEHRGVVTATVVYDRVPIQDALRWLDRDALLGMMDCRGVEQPLFFVLRRHGDG